MIPENYQAWTGLDKVDGKGFSKTRDPSDHPTGIDSDSDNINYVDKKSSSQSEPYGRDYPIEKMSDTPAEEEDEDYKNRETDEENHDEEISSLFQDALVKLEEIKEHTNQQKKQIVVELAKDLEGKIPTDTICMEIVTQLRGQVSERFVRECLDEKYKQKPRVKNARKQKKKQDNLEEKEAIDKLSEVTNLTPGPENGKINLVGTNGQSLVQRDGDSNDKRVSDSDDNSSKDNTESSSAKLTNQKEHEQQLGANNDPRVLIECPVCRVVYGEIISLKLQLRALEFELRSLKLQLRALEFELRSLKLQLRALEFELRSLKLQLDKVFEELKQFASAYEMKNADKAKDVKNTSKILDFEFCKLYDEVWKYVNTFSPFDNFADVWFSGKIDTSTGVVILSSCGRATQHQKRPTIETTDDEGDTVG